MSLKTIKFRKEWKKYNELTKKNTFKEKDTDSNRDDNDSPLRRSCTRGS